MCGGLYKNIPLRGKLGSLSVQHHAFHAGSRGLWRDAWVIYQEAGLLCAAVYDVQQPDYILPGASFSHYHLTQMAQHCIQDIFAHCQYCRGTKGCEPEGNQLGRCLAPAGGNCPVYRSSGWRQEAPCTLGALKGAEACRGGGVRTRQGNGVRDGVGDGAKRWSRGWSEME